MNIDEPLKSLRSVLDGLTEAERKHVRTALELAFLLGETEGMKVMKEIYSK